MKKCVLYYNRGQKCIIKLIVSIASLRKHYDGDIILAAGDEQPEYLLKRLKRYNVIIRQTEKSTVNNALADKPALARYVEDYDLVLYLDSDTLVYDNIDNIWDYIKNYGFVVTNFTNWVTKGGMIENRIREWSKVLPEKEINLAVEYGRAVNTGVFGFSRKYRMSEYNIFLEWHELTLKGQKENCTRRMVDELACQVLLHKYPHIMLNTTWNTSAKFYRGKSEDVKIWHYHGYKHTYKDEFEGCQYWYDQYMELINEDFIGIKDVFGDRRLKNASWRKGMGWEVA